MEFAEGFTELTVCDLVVLDVEGVEDRLVEEAALLVVAASVQLVGLFEEGKASVDELGAVGEVGVGCFQALLQPAALAGDVAQLLLDLGPRQRAVGSEVDQVLLLRVEFLELCGELLAQQACGLFLLAEHGIDLVAHVSDERLAEANRGVVALNRVLDERDVDVRCLAQPLLPAAAEEVQVLGALRVDGPLDDHPPLDTVALAASTEERSLEVVVVHATAFLCRHARFENLLDCVEEILVDERLVPPLDFFAVVLDVSEVVAIPQHLRNLVLGDLLGWVSPGGPGVETAVVELVSQLFLRVVAGGEELETQLDKVRPVGVDDDRADHAAVGVVDVVEVAELRAAERAAVAGLLAHLVGDVGTGLAGLVLVEGGQDAVHQLADRGVVDGLGGRDQGDAALAQVRHDDRVVVAVPRHARELVDDDDVDVALAAHPREHLLECFAFGHLRSRASGLDVLVDDRDAQIPRLAQARFPLGRNGDAFRVVVGPNLPGRGHAQVDHCASAGGKVLHRRLDRDGDILLQFIDEFDISAGHDTSF